MSTQDPMKVEIDKVEDITPHNKALYEAGKGLLVESVSVGREFCKFMTTTTLSAIPLYLGLLKFVLPEAYVFQSRDELLFLAPPAIFLSASILFIVGYFPQKGSFSLDLPEEIETERDAAIHRRRRYSILGFTVFALGVTVATYLIVARFPSD